MGETDFNLQKSLITNKYVAPLSQLIGQEPQNPFAFSAGQNKVNGTDMKYEMLADCIRNNERFGISPANSPLAKKLGQEIEKLIVKVEWITSLSKVKSRRGEDVGPINITYEGIKVKYFNSDVEMDDYVVSTKYKFGA